MLGPLVRLWTVIGLATIYYASTSAILASLVSGPRGSTEPLLTSHDSRTPVDVPHATGEATHRSERKVTLEELARHNRKEDCWIACQGKVYNITHFLTIHPGGESVLMKRAGTDLTRDFLERHPRYYVDIHLGGWLVGTLSGMNGDRMTVGNEGASEL